MNKVVEVEGLRRARLVRARLLQWRLLSRRRPPARWFGSSSGNTGPAATCTASTSSSTSSSSTNSSSSSAFLENEYPKSRFAFTYCHHRQLRRPSFFASSSVSSSSTTATPTSNEEEQEALSQLSDFASGCPELLELIFHYVRSRELRACSVAGKAFKYQLDCQETWRQLYFLRFHAAFGLYTNWKFLYIQRDERCDRIRTWRAYFEAGRRGAALAAAAAAAAATGGIGAGGSGVITTPSAPLIALELAYHQQGGYE